MKIPSYNKIGGAVLWFVGIFNAGILVRSILLDKGLGGVYAGLFVTLLMAGSGVYSFLGKRFNLVVRVLWSIGFMFGVIVPIQLILGSYNAGLVKFVGMTSVLFVIYGGLLGSTILDVVDSIPSLKEI